jgi:hypothetical protein
MVMAAVIAPPVRLLATDPARPAIEFTLPVRTKNSQNFPTGNTRLAAIIRTQERARHRGCALLLTRAAMMRLRVSAADLVPCVVTLTRLSAGTMDDDGLAGSCKGLRDGIAEALGIDDGSSAVKWNYAQAKCPRGQHAVRVHIQRRPTP